MRLTRPGARIASSGAAPKTASKPRRNCPVVTRTILRALLIARSARSDEVEAGLPARQPGDRAVGQGGVLLQCDPRLLPAPLRHRVPHVELDRVAGIVEQLVVAAARHVLLLVPQPDRRPGGVAVVAEWVAVDARGEPLVARLPQCRAQHLVAGAAGDHRPAED